MDKTVSLYFIHCVPLLFLWERVIYFVDLGCGHTRNLKSPYFVNNRLLLSYFYGEKFDPRVR